MKTKFILHGGNLRADSPNNDSYFREVIKDFEDGDELLFIGWAKRDINKRNKTYEREKEHFLSRTNKKIKVVYASDKNLINEIKSAKAIHITGGKSPELVNDLRKYPEFIDALKAKTVGGSSAGACLFSRYYFYTDITGVQEGLGVLPIRLKVHYGNPEFGNTNKAFK